MSPVSTLFVSIKSSKCLQDMSSRHLQDISSRRLQDQQMFAGKLALSASWTHGLINDGLNWLPDMYIYYISTESALICMLYIIINFIYIYIYIYIYSVYDSVCNASNII